MQFQYPQRDFASDSIELPGLCESGMHRKRVNTPACKGAQNARRCGKMMRCLALIIPSAISISRDSITHNIKKERNTGISPCSSGMIRAGKERTKIDDSPGAIYKNTYEEEYF